jgi:hypothetical protein
MARLLSTVLALTVVVLLSGCISKETQDISEQRTARRTTIGQILYPDFLFKKPEHYEFLPYTSNYDPQNQHPQQWDGQDWDSSAWNAEQWTPRVALTKLYQNRTFVRQSARGKDVGVLVVGPTFYKLSDLDQRRSLKLLADYTQLFEHGYGVIELRDWSTNEVIGHYTKRGMHLN